MKNNPTREIKKLNIPILIIQGTTDLQVKVEDAELLKAANPKSELQIIEGMNHVFRDAPMDKSKNVATYKDASIQINTELVKVLSQFILSENN